MTEKPLFWNKDSLGLSVESEALRAPLLAAMDIWNAVPCGRLRLVLDPQSVNKIILRQKQNWEFESNALAMTTLIYYGNPAILEKVKIEVNQGDRHWTPIDYQNILLHELGHFLGLGHSEKFDSVMHPIGQLGDSERELSKEDQENFCALAPLYPDIAHPEEPKTGCSQTGFSSDSGLLIVLMFTWFICCKARKHSSICRVA